MRFPHGQDEDVWYIDGGQRFASASELERRRFHNTLITDMTKKQIYIPPLSEHRIYQHDGHSFNTFQVYSGTVSHTDCVLEVVYIL